MSSSSPPSLVWFLLVGADGEPYQGTTADAVSLPPTSFILQLRKAVKAENPNKLASLDASDLKVYRNKAAFDGKEEPLEEDSTIAGLGGSKKEALIVLVPAPLEASPLSVKEVSFERSWDENAAKAFESFEKTAQVLFNANDPILESLRNIFERYDNEPNKPFVFVDGSSGLGKTQLAFTLSKFLNDRQVLYVNCASSKSTDQLQPVYMLFSNTSSAFLDCAEKDYASIQGKVAVHALSGESLLVFGFLREFVQNEYQGTHQIRPLLAEQVRDAHQGKAPVLVLDEFQPFTEAAQRGGKLRSDPDFFRFLRNVGRAAGLRVMIMGTDSTAANMAIASLSSRQNNGEWCALFSKLPPFRSDGYSSSVPDPLRTILESSRPWFSILVLEEWERMQLTRLNAESLLKAAVGAVNNIWSDKDIHLHEFGRHGQVCLFLAAHFVAETTTPKLPLVHRHFAQLWKANSLPEPILLNSRLEVLNRIPRVSWKPISVMPNPKDDLLLHLLLTGIPGVCAMRNGDGDEVSYLSAVKAAEENLLGRLFLLLTNNPTQATNSGMQYEAIVAGAIGLASHKFGYSGCTLVQFLDELLFQLTPTSTPAVPLAFPQLRVNPSPFSAFEKWDFLKQMVIPFLSPPGQDWPEIVHEIEDGFFGNLIRTVNSDKVDIRVGDWFFVECMDHKNCISLPVMKGILTRVQNGAKIHLVLSNRLQNSYFEDGTFGTFAKGTFLEHCCFYRISTESAGNLLFVKGLSNATKPKCLVLFIETFHGHRG